MIQSSATMYLSGFEIILVYDCLLFWKNQSLLFFPNAKKNAIMLSALVGCEMDNRKKYA
jgi:hypothetical protein